MQTDLKVDFHGASPTEALQAKIREHVDDLEQFYGRLTACHVSVEAPGHHHRKGGLYHVRIRLSLPNGHEANIGTTPPSDHRHADIVFALNDAFRRARRQLQDTVRKVSSEVRARQSRRSAR
jgi:ribosome-associated translation inhibitor RaiA